MRMIEALFAKFAAIYGAKFVDQWTGIDQKTVKATWAEALGELDRGEIVGGIRALVHSGSPFPPTLPEFYGMCRPKIDVPPVSDHAGLDALARQHCVPTIGCDSYYALRQRLCERLIDDRGRQPLLT